jgi:hypothetical protein
MTTRTQPDRTLVNRNLIIFGIAVLVGVSAVTALAASTIGVPPQSINGRTHAVAKNGSLKANAVGNRQIKRGAVSCRKLSYDLAAALCVGNPGQAKTMQTAVPGNPGTNGVDGTPGKPGDTGAKGNAGNPGLNGSTGPAGVPGSPGATGAPGPAGANAATPLIFGPYNSGSTDSSICGGDWANDTYTRTYIVTPMSDGSFQVSELFQGVFVTIAGNSPNDSHCGTTDDDVAGGLEGTFYGDYALIVPAPADFAFTSECPAGCTTTEFFATFFDSAIPSVYAWQFRYHTALHGTWSNTDHGNTGNIT